MSLRDLVEPECGGANPLMRLGNHLVRDAAYKDEGLSGGQFFGQQTQQYDNNQYVNEFLGQIAGPPQTFRMDDLLKEMRDIDKTFPQKVIRAPPVIDQVNNNAGVDWAKEFSSNHTEFNFSAPGKSEAEVWGTFPQTIDQQQRNPDNPVNWTSQFFELNEQNKTASGATIPEAAGELVAVDSKLTEEQINYSEFMKFMRNVSDGDVRIGVDNRQSQESWIDDFQKSSLDNEKSLATLRETSEDWAEAFHSGKQEEMESTESYNNQFWNRLQDEWKRISEQDDSSEHPWLNQFADYYDPYREYKFDEENSMIDIENAFEKGKAFMEHGDIPSAVLCFEAAIKQNSENPEIWELLGLAQAENEKDPNAIAALKKSLELRPGNLKVLMALAVSYTNESIQNLALKSLIQWMALNPKYQAIVPPQMMTVTGENSMSSIIAGPELKEVENLFLRAVQQHPNAIDPDIQEALGVLFNLSSEYDKAVDCFQAALQVRPDNPKTWNRLGASLANGNRSIEAVDAYKRALDIYPGYIRARYNVGIICINLKSYKEAMEHFLTALNHQANSTARSGIQTTLPSNKMSDTIWSTLKMTVSLMGRHDLQYAVDGRDLNTLNAAFATSE